MSSALRSIQFADLSEVVAEVESLNRTGCRQSGEWSLGQICIHLSLVMRASIEGFPAPPASVRVPLWFYRNTLARFPKGRAAVMRAVTGSVGTFPEMVPAASVEDAEGIGELKRWIALTQDHQGAFKPSPSLGPLTAGDVEALHLAHCAHHLGFLAPKLDASS